MGKVIDVSMTVSEELDDYLAATVGDESRYASIGDFLRDLLQRDYDRLEQERYAALKTELQRALAAPESSFHASSAEDVFARNASR